MVAKINRGVSLYGAITYNQQKVNDTTARIIAGNRMITDVAGNPDRVMQQTLWAFDNYLLANKNTEKPILHISLNPSVDDRLTDAQFAELAKEYMQRMGYGDQPYIVYVHEDIDRRHIHIVSTCVNEKGEKIDDTYEWNRSMKACRELEKKFGLKQVEDKRKELLEPYMKKADYQSGDVKRQVSNIVKSVFTTYRFQSFGEFSALLSCFNIEAKQVRGEFDGTPYNGIVYTMTDDTGKPVCTPVKSSLIGKQYGYEGLEKRIGYNAREYRNKKWQPKIRNEVALPCTDAVETGTSSSVCLPEKALMRYSVKMTRDVSMERLSSTTRTGRCTTAPGSARSSRQMPSSGCSTVRSIFPIWTRLCLTLTGKAVSPPIWKVPSSRLSESSALKPTVPTRRKRLLPAGCNARRKRSAAPVEYPDYRIYKRTIKIISLCNKKMI